jgi:hypothetical protein
VWLTYRCVDAERREHIEDGVDYGLRRGDAAGLARALAAKGLDRRRLPEERHVKRGQSPVRGTAYSIKEPLSS